MSESLLRATEEEKLEILQKHSAFVFDLDGTLWKGTDLVPGASEVLELLRYQVGSGSTREPRTPHRSHAMPCHHLLQGKKVYFVTNNSTLSRQEFLRKCQALGLKASLVRRHAMDGSYQYR